MDNNIWLNAIPEGWMIYPDDMYYISNWKDFTMDPHRHGCLEINYIPEGACLYQFDWGELRLRRRNLILFNSAQNHRVIFSNVDDQPGAVLGGSFYARDAAQGCVAIRELMEGSEDLLRLSRLLSAGPVILPDAHTLSALLRHIRSEFEESGDMVYLNLLLGQLLVEIARATGNERPYLNDHVRRIKEYIQYNYGSPLSMEDIASNVCLSKNYMERIFKQQTGITVWQYLTDIRMKDACRLLRDTNMCVGEIDEHVGVNSRQNFYLLFRKAYGISPAAYRKRARLERENAKG